MKLTKRNGIYVLDMIDAKGKRQRRSLRTRNKAEAEQQAVRLLNGEDSRLDDGWTLKRALRHTLDSVWADSKSYRSFASIVRLVSAELGHLPVTEVTYGALNSWVQTKRAEGLKPGTINRRLAAIGRALKEAVLQEKLTAVPPMPKQKENNKKLRWLTEDEEQRLLLGCRVLPSREAERMRHCIAFLIDTGARLGEMFALRRGHIRGSQVRFENTKAASGTYKARAVPLTKRARIAALEIATLNEYELMWTPSQLTKRFDKAAADVRLEGVTRHTLRHTCASRLVQRGADLYRVKEWLGHSNVTVTERYAHLADTGMSDLAGLLETSTDNVADLRVIKR